MSITRDELKSCMLAINNEYENFLPNNIEQQRLKVNTWYLALSEYSYKDVQNATMQLLCTFTYGTPKLAHIIEILEPKMENINEGIEFATRLMNLNYRIGTKRDSIFKYIDGVPTLFKIPSGDMMGDIILEEYGKIGYSIYRQVKHELYVLKIEDENNFKAQMRDLYNSLHRKEEIKRLTPLPYETEAQKLLADSIKKIMSKKRIENSEDE